MPFATGQKMRQWPLTTETSVREFGRHAESSSAVALASEYALAPGDSSHETLQLGVWTMEMLHVSSGSLTPARIVLQRRYLPPPLPANCPALSLEKPSTTAEVATRRILSHVSEAAKAGGVHTTRMASVPAVNMSERTIFVAYMSF